LKINGGGGGVGPSRAAESKGQQKSGKMNILNEKKLDVLSSTHFKLL